MSTSGRRAHSRPPHQSARQERSRRLERQDRPVCQSYKYTGECHKKKCRDRHLRPLPSSDVVECFVAIPEKLPIALAVGRHWYHPNRIMQNFACFVELLREERQFRIVAERGTLKNAKEAMELYLANLHPQPHSLCCIHAEGTSKLEGSMLKLEHYHGRWPGNAYGDDDRQQMYHICVIEKDESVPDVSSSCGEEVTENQTVESIPEASCAYSATEIVKSKAISIGDHKGDIKVKITEALDHFSRTQDYGCTAKLEARLGKVIWTNLPEDILACDEGITPKNLAELLHNEHVRRLFNTVVLKASVDGLCSIFHDGTRVETFDISVTITEGNVRLNIRLRILETGELQLLLSKKNEKKLQVSDIICLHRQHDIRIALNSVDIIPHDEFTIVKKILRTIRYSKAEQALTFVPQSDGWCLTFIRHKIRTPYVVDDKHIVTCSCIEDHGVDWMKHHQDEPFTLMLKDFNERHYEMELHNTRWVCAFGKSARLSPKESLERMLQMDSTDVTRELVTDFPDQWTPEDIAQDLDQFLECAEYLNDLLEET